MPSEVKFLHIKIERHVVFSFIILWTCWSIPSGLSWTLVIVYTCPYIPPESCQDRDRDHIDQHGAWWLVDRQDFDLLLLTASADDLWSSLYVYLWHAYGTIYYSLTPTPRYHRWWRNMTIIGNKSLQWRHNERDGVLYHQPHDCLLNRLFGHRSMKTSKLRVTGLRAVNSTVTGVFALQMASNAEKVSIWWRHHANSKCISTKVWYTTNIHSCSIV